MKSARTPFAAARRFERRPLGAEPHDDGPRLDSLERVEEHVHALLLDQLAEVDDGREVAGEERGESLGVAAVGDPLLAVPRVRPVARGLLEQAGEGDVPGLGLPEVDVDARRDLVHAVDVPADVPEHLPDVPRADERRARAGERLRSPRRQLRVPAHRVLELGPVGLDGERRAGSRPDRASEQHVVREHEVGGQERTHGGGVRLHPRVELGAGAVLDETDLVPLVVVEDEGR